MTGDGIFPAGGCAGPGSPETSSHRTEPRRERRPWSGGQAQLSAINNNKRPVCLNPKRMSKLEAVSCGSRSPDTLCRAAGSGGEVEILRNTNYTQHRAAWGRELSQLPGAPPASLPHTTGCRRTDGPATQTGTTARDIRTEASCLSPPTRDAGGGCIHIHRSHAAGDKGQQCPPSCQNPLPKGESAALQAGLCPTSLSPPSERDLRQR